MTRAARIGAATAAFLLLAAGPAPAEEGLAGELVANATYTLESFVAGFQHDYPDSARRIDDTVAESWSRFSAESKASLGPGLTFAVKAFGVLSTQEDERRGAFSEPGYRAIRPRTVDLVEAKVRWALEGLDLSAGKMTHAVGVSNLFSPANRFNNLDASSPMHPIELGVWSTRADIFVGDDTLALAVIPWQDRAGVPSSGSRWLGASGSYDFPSIDRSALGVPADATLVFEDRFRASRPRNYGYLAHYKGARHGFDFFGAVHNGPSIYSILRQDLSNNARFIVETPPAFTIAAGLSATSGAWGYYGEAAAQFTHQGRDQDFVKYLLGVSYRESEIAEAIGLEEIIPIVEYANERIFEQQDNPRYVVNSLVTRPGRGTVLARLALRQSDKLGYTFGWVRNYHGRDYFWTAGAEYKLTDSLKLRADLRAFAGNADTPFGRWGRNDHIEVGFSYKF
jgi:hypothetical protein